MLQMHAHIVTIFVTREYSSIEVACTLFL